MSRGLLWLMAISLDINRKTIWVIYIMGTVLCLEPSCEQGTWFILQLAWVTVLRCSLVSRPLDKELLPAWFLSWYFSAPGTGSEDFTQTVSLRSFIWPFLFAWSYKNSLCPPSPCCVPPFSTPCDSGLSPSRPVLPFVKCFSTLGPLSMPISHLTVHG